MKQIFRTLGILLISAALFCCVSKPQVGDESFRTLLNQGILPVSTTNAYVGSNLFLASEAQRSPVLRNFLEARGAPLGIEVTQGSIRGSLGQIIMYYPREKQAYTADAEERRITQTASTREWIIRGPYQIGRMDYRQLLGVTATEHGQPVFMFRGKEHRFGPADEPEVETKTILIPVFPTPAPKAKTKKPVHKPSAAAPAPSEFKPMNSDQQALLMSKGYAERGENGDIIHSVFGAETLVVIAEWYTGSAANADAIAQANGLAIGAPLSTGQRIRIPVKMAKNTKQLIPTVAIPSKVEQQALPTLVAPTPAPEPISTAESTTKEEPQHESPSESHAEEAHH